MVVAAAGAVAARAGGKGSGSKYRCGRELLILMNGDSGGCGGSGGSSGFIPRARAHAHAHTHVHYIYYARAAAAVAYAKSNSPARAVPGRPSGLTVLGTRDYIKYVPNGHRRGSACRLFTFGQRRRRRRYYTLLSTAEPPSNICRSTLPVAVRPYYCVYIYICMGRERESYYARTPPLLRRRGSARLHSYRIV